MLQATLEAGIDRIVYISSIAALGDTGGSPAREDHEHGPNFPSHYERTKHEAHQVARGFVKKGLGVRQVMPGVVYGPGDPSAMMDYFRDFVRGRLPARVGEDTVQSFVHVDDVVDGIVRVLESGRDGEEYLLAGFPHSFREVNALLELLTGVRPPRLRMPLGLARIYARLSEGFGHLLGRKVLVTREGIETMADLCYMFDSSKVIEELGWKPRIFPVGLAETVESLGVILRSDPRPKAPSAKEEPEGAASSEGDAAAPEEAAADGATSQDEGAESPPPASGDAAEKPPEAQP
jgi:dihydroflavonol-4-reductase